MDDAVRYLRRRRVVATVGLALVLAAAVAQGLRAARTDTAAGTRPGALPGELRTPPPWPANDGADLRARLAAIGLPALSREGTRLHVHAHLDVFVAGRHVAVPAGIGIDAAGRFIAPLHTHDASGIVHVESPTIRTFTLGELFDVWGVRFGDGCLGGACGSAGRQLRVYAGGRRVAQPFRLPLAAHQELVVTYGTRAQLPRSIPSAYTFPEGL